MTVVLFLNVLTAANFLDPLPPLRRSGEDFIGRAKPAGRMRPCNQLYNIMHVATQYLYCVAQNNPKNAAAWPRCENHPAD
jgi:hypothetical protein